MNSPRFLHSRQALALAAALLLVIGGPALAGAASEAPGGEPVEGFVTIATGADSSVDGFLSVPPDDFGQWASAGFGGGGDIFNPAGAALPLEATFTSAMFLFVPSASQRTVLTENPSYTAIATDGSLTLAVTSPLAASDADMNGTDDTLVSSFTATGTGTDLSFDLTQTVAPGDDPGVAVVTQDYVITNNGANSIDLVLARVYDGDLLWEGMAGNEFSDDSVGTSFNGARGGVGGDRFVVEQEPSGDPATSITISSPNADSYFGGKNGIQPGGGPPPYNFGTDTEVFDNFGVPVSWQNNIANVGYDTDGFSGPTPPGSTPPEDGFVGLGFTLTLGAGESSTISVATSFGAVAPPLPPEPPITSEFDIAIPTLNWAGLLALMVGIAIAGGFLLRRRF